MKLFPLFVLLLSGCMNITVQTMPENLNVKAVHEGSDCVPIVFGLSWGEAKVNEARSWLSINERANHATIRSIAMHDYYFLFAGAHCVEVTGE